MLKGDVKMALASLRSSKWRSLLTMFGVIIGVASVVTTVSLGEGIKQQVVTQITRLGNDLITIRPGKIVNRDSEGRITKVNALNGYNFTGGSLPAGDVEAVEKTDGVKTVVPIGVVGGRAKVDSREYEDGYILATGSSLPTMLNHKVQYGDFFSAEDNQAYVAVIGRNVAARLFDESVPVGRTITILNTDFVVQGVFDAFSSPPLPLGPDFNNTIFIPYETANRLTGNNIQLVQILVRPDDPSQVNSVISSVNKTLDTTHGQQENYTVLRQDENLTVTRDIINLLTAFIAGIAATSLLVGGIGIMNIMFLSVTERTKEIGIRKAIGATNRQILGQFLVEASVLSFVGSLTGLLLAGFINLLLRIFTHLQPAVTAPIVIIACLVSILVGVLFGMIPAAKAASKDPIEALRYE